LALALFPPRPGAGQFPGNAGVGDDFQEAGALAFAMLRQAPCHILGTPEVVPGVAVALVEME